MIFCKFNATFQSDLSMLPSLKAEVLRLLRILLGKFLISEAIAMTQENLIAVNLSDSSLQLPDNQLGIGHEAWRYLSEEEDYFDPDTLTIFFSGVREFYKAVTSTILNKFTFNDHFFDDIAFLLLDNRCSETNATVQYLAR